MRRARRLLACMVAARRRVLRPFARASGSSGAPVPLHRAIESAASCSPPTFSPTSGPRRVVRSAARRRPPQDQGLGGREQRRRAAAAGLPIATQRRRRFGLARPVRAVRPADLTRLTSGAGTCQRYRRTIRALSARRTRRASSTAAPPRRQLYRTGVLYLKPSCRAGAHVSARLHEYATRSGSRRPRWPGPVRALAASARGDRQLKVLEGAMPPPFASGPPASASGSNAARGLGDERLSRTFDRRISATALAESAADRLRLAAGASFPPAQPLQAR